MEPNRSQSATSTPKMWLRSPKLCLRNLRLRAHSEDRNTGPAAEVKPHFLTDRQQTLILRTWKDDFDALYALGARIYDEIFERAPHARHMFAASKHGDNWRESKEFHAQGLKFVQVLSLVVARLRQVETSMNPMLQDLGFRHQKFVSRGFKPELWDAFLDGMHEVIADQMRHDAKLSDDEKACVAEAWKILAEHIIEKMRQGFQMSKSPLSNDV